MHTTAENFDKVHDELLAKIGDSQESRSRYGDLSLDTRTRSVRGARGAAKLTPTEYQILWLLVRGQGTIISRDEFSYFLYEESDNDIPLCNTVEVFIVRLRKKLRDITPTVIISTFKGIGYQLSTLS